MNVRAALGVAACIAVVGLAGVTAQGWLRAVHRVADWVRDEPSASPWFVLDGRIEGEWELIMADWKVSKRCKHRRDSLRIQILEREYTPPSRGGGPVELPTTVIARGVVDWPDCRWAFQLDAFDPGLWLRPSSMHDFGDRCEDGWGDKVLVSMLCKRDRADDVLVLNLGPKLPWLHYRRARPR